ncbi:hypothetical protein E2C01_024295 [Portunus trituberculatus]|uniref:Uncharacterized protein n=1 Tax=Portunus trituberculatus TaxID=210409 RepID=A0A5B7EA60_PORTR|nr:hypothetical protein [Portunus trituberculatus]
MQWNHACFGVRGVSKRTGLNPVHGLSEGFRIWYKVLGSWAVSSDEVANKESKRAVSMSI